MKNSLETRLGIFVALAIICAFIILEVLGGGLESFKRGTQVAALFDNIIELKVGDPVKMAGVPIGRVETVSFATNKVMVTMKVSREALVRTDSKATIKFAGLLGQNYISLDFGTEGAPLAADGAILASGEQADLNQLMGKLDNVASGVENLTRSFTGDKIDNLLGPLTDFLKQNQEPLTATFSNLQSVTTAIAAGEGTIGKMIREETLYNDLQTTIANANGALTDARSVLAQVNEGKGTLGKLLTDDKLYVETSGSMTTLHEILQKVNKGDGTASQLLNDPSFYKNANLTLQKVDKATESLEDQGVLSVLGLAVGRLF